MLPQRKSEHLKTEPSWAKAAQEGLPRSKSDASFSVATSARHLTVVTDPAILEEIRKRKAQRTQASRAVTVNAGGQRYSTRLPEDGWVFSASEEPFALRGWRSSEDPDSPAARLAADWGVAAASCKGCKARGDFSLGQDNFLLAKLANEWKVVCVFDGHGVDGHWPAERVTETIPHFLDQEPCSSLLKTGEAAEALSKAFKSAQEDLEAYAVEVGNDLHLCGTTATVALIPPSQDAVWVATLGDSRAVLMEKRVLQETSDHKATRKDEMRRVKAAGGQIIVTEYEDGTEDARIAPNSMASPQIAISRSFGDMIFKDAGVCATPEIVHWDSVSPDALLVICSDGVWEFLSSEDVCDFLQEAVQTSGPEAALALLRLAKRAWNQNEAFYCDDITVVLAKVKGSLPVNLKSAEPCPGCQNQSCFQQ